jgi:hypothetical protein
MRFEGYFDFQGQARSTTHPPPTTPVRLRAVLPTLPDPLLLLLLLLLLLAGYCNPARPPAKSTLEALEVQW